jgi:medium-chain acyl-[acyl-carrier-protein] hydrolase
MPAETTLFCFPYSGASAAFFRAWINRIPAVEVYPVDLPGHGARISEPLFTIITPLVEAVATSILPVLRPPYAFFGHSMGALVAYELARTLVARRHSAPVHLFVSGHGAPHLEDPEPPIHNLPEDEFIQKIQGMNGTAEKLFEHPELRAMFLPILRADFTICETYRHRPGPLLPCPITALGGIGDPSVPRAALEAWREHSAAAFKVHLFPGDHFYLKQPPAALMEILARELIGVRV